MKHKICHLTSAHNRNDVRIFLKQCHSLVNNNFDVSFIVANGLDNEIVNNIKIFDVGKLGGRINRIFLTTKKIYKKALQLNCDVYHFHDPELIAAGLMLKKKGKKVIYDVHEDIPRQILSKFYIPIIFRKTLSFLVEKLENYASKKFDKIVTATPYIRDRFLKIGADAIDINNFPLLNEFKFSHINWENKKNQVCYIGAITKVRGAVELIESFTELDLKLVLAGRYQPIELRKQLVGMQAWKECKIEEKGFVGRDKINLILEESKIGLVTLHPIINYLDSLPIKMFEYMAAGIPFVASNFSYWKEIASKNNCGICVDPKDSKSIEKGIRYLINNPKKAQEMGKNGRQAVEKKYNWLIEEEKLIKLYKEIVKPLCI